MLEKEELIEKLKLWIDDNSKSLPHWANTIAVRYDDKKYMIFEEIPVSKSGIADSEIGELPGTSAWFTGERNDDYDDATDRGLEYYLDGQDETAYKHCNIIIGQNTNYDTEDESEVILENATVVYCIF